MRVAAVLGGAAGGLNELAQLRAMATVDAVFAINDAACDYDGYLAAFVTLHPEFLLDGKAWLTKRRAAGRSEPREVIAHEMKPGVTRVVDYLWPGMNASGSSGLFAAKVALEQFDRVVLCGVPMQAERAHYFDAAPWHDVNGFTDAWRIALPHLANVRSMSGWTAELLGRPDSSFLRPFVTHPAGGTPVLNSEML